MNTLSESTNKEMNGGNMNFNSRERVLANQSRIVEQFFKTDGVSEMIGSLHRLVEDFLFTPNLREVTPEMRIHIVNQLRVATLVAQLGENYGKLKSI